VRFLELVFVWSDRRGSVDVGASSEDVELMVGGVARIGKFFGKHFQAAVACLSPMYGIHRRIDVRKQTAFLNLAQS